MTVHAATQGVHITRIGVAMRLGLDADKVRVLAGDIGGSFGLKIGASREELAVAAASRALGRPVKWIEDRGENLTASGQAREESFDVRAAVSDDGELLGLDVEMVIDTGAYPGMGAMVPAIIEGMMPGPVQDRGAGLRVHRGRPPTRRRTSPTAARGRPRRSSGNASSTCSPKDLGLDPLEIRLRNVAPRPTRRTVMITGRPLAGVTAKESLERVAELHRHPGLPAAGRPRSARAAATSASAWPPSSRPRPARARPRGRAARGHGAHAPAARRRRHRGAVHRPDAARPEPPDDPGPDRRRRVRRAVRAGPRRRRRQRRRCPFGLTGGSRSATMTGGVALHGARQLKAKVLDFAAAPAWRPAPPTS